MSGKQLRAFVLMPFLDELDWAYEQLIKPAFEAAKYAVVRADDIDSQQNILKDIVTAIAESDVVVADLTGANPNVYYELGLAHALQKQVVLLSQDVQKAPFDLRSYRIIEYGDRFDQFQGALERLRKLAHDISAERVRFGSPISDFIPRTRAAPATDTADAKETSDDVAAVERTHDEIVEEDGEPGMLDLVTDTEEGFAEQTELLANATKQITLLGEYATDVTPRIQALTAAGDYKGLRSIFLNLSTLYDARTSDLCGVNKQLRLSWERTSNALEKRFYHSVTNAETRGKLLRGTREMCSKADETRVVMDDFTRKVDSLPNIDRVLTRSKRKLVNELRELVAFTQDVASFEGRLTGILENDD